MAEKWTPEEWDNRRRIVVFSKAQQGSYIQASFRAVPLAERPPNSICISCIYWAEKKEFFVTLVDTIHLLEHLVVGPARFTVHEKNRIRRNLKVFDPLTVSKGKSETEDLFKVIMAFRNPKPRNIEQPIKVFRWKDLGPALKEIISQYSQSLSSTCAPPCMRSPVLTPVNLSGAYPQQYTPLESQTNMFWGQSPQQYLQMGYHSSYQNARLSSLPLYSERPTVVDHQLPSVMTAARVLQSRPKPQCWEHGCNGRQFSTFSNLLRHQREQSGDAAKASCPNCGAKFTRTTTRNSHLRKVHALG
ncbi:hypothetical protein NKR19_g9594 [Coniochaeta hoffmannii]|uniref:C2H2-type domain-containing protein n=1 Tax=Coniochaeta hoffmannii TaxID=91930 RepID=A0AA38R9C5_9PEZI|nr:hypothetical protein NKR19_g9594 [Coniochaeta hoffmannii]